MITPEGEKDVPTNKPTRSWRLGPARLFYDDLGVSTDENDLDYSDVFQLGAGDDITAAEVRRLKNAEEEQRLEIAIQSILPREDECVAEIENQEEQSLSEERPVEIDPIKEIRSRLESERAAYNLMDIMIHLDDSSSSADNNDEPVLDLQDETGTQKDETGTQKDETGTQKDETGAQKDETGTQKDETGAQKDETGTQKDETGTQKDETGAQKDHNDSHCLVNQVEWENDVIWTPKETSANISAEKQARAGWIPTYDNRSSNSALEGDTFKSMFSFENQALPSGTWEADVIWNVEDFLRDLPSPKLPVYEATNEQFVFEMPEDILQVVETSVSEPDLTISKKKSESHTASLQQSSKTMPKQTEIVEPISSPSKSPQYKKDFYNISNDHCYHRDILGKDDMKPIRLDNLNLRHSQLVTSMTPPFLKYYLSREELRNFHRPKLTHERNAPVPADIPHVFKSLAGRIRAKLKKTSELLLSNQPILMDEPLALSGKDGHILLVENCEKYPPLLSQVGMCSKLINYCQRTRSLKDTDAIPNPPLFGETVFVNALPSPYLGSLKEGQIFSTLENNLYCSPIYSHTPCNTDFLVIRNRYGYLIREFDASFTAGQQCPLFEVPAPKSAKASQFSKDLVKVFSIRKFRESPQSRVLLDEIVGTFPNLLESRIKNCLNPMADFLKMDDSTWVVKKPSLVLPSEDDLVEMISPEQCCAYFSMLAAEQRLKDAGFGSMLSLLELSNGDKENKETGGNQKFKKDERSRSKVQQSQSQLQEELNTAPWNTTAAFIAAARGKCILQIEGPADPTGCGEGFSYVRITKGEFQQQSEERIKKVASQIKSNGFDDTEIDRALTIKAAKELLRKAGVPDKKFRKKRRSELVEFVRTLSAKKAKLGDMRMRNEISKFCLQNTKSTKTKSKTNQSQACYKEDCQRVFELQNTILSSGEILSTDDEDEDENQENELTNQEEIDKMGESIETILNSEKDKAQLLYEEEERERVQLQLMMLGKVKAKDMDIARKEREKQAAAELKKKNDSKDVLKDLLANPGRCLKFIRTFDNDDGTTYTEMEIVRDPMIISVYLKIRTTKDEQFIKGFLKQADSKDRREENIVKKELLNKLKKKQTQQITKVERLSTGRKRKLEEDDDWFPSKTEKTKIARKLNARKRKCGKCGLLGHVSTSTGCPMFIPKQKGIRKKKGKVNKKMVPPPPTKPSKTDSNTQSNLGENLLLSSDSEEDDTSSDSGSTSGSDSSTSTE